MLGEDGEQYIMLNRQQRGKTVGAWEHWAILEGNEHPTPLGDL